MKKTITIILSTILVFCFAFSAFANNTAQFTYTYDNFSVTFNEDTCFDSTQREKIANVLANEGEYAEPAGLACLFGHDWLEDSVTTITHCVSDTQPRCLEETFDIFMCSRCEKTKVELLGRTYIYCCP